MRMLNLLISESYPHGSAQNIDVITRSMCDQLVNTCKADDTARNTCANATTAASNATPAKTGIQADAFNAVFGVTTNFADDPVFDDQGRVVSGDANNGNGNNSTDGGNNGKYGGNNGNQGGDKGGKGGDNGNKGGKNGNNGDKGDEKGNKGGNNGDKGDENGNKGGNNGNHGGNVGGNTGNDGSCIPVDGGNNNNGTDVGNNNGTVGGNNNGTNGGNNNNNGTDGGNNGTIGNFGSCSVPEIEFGAGFDNRRETSFQPVDLGESDLFCTCLRYPSKSVRANAIDLGCSELQPQFRPELRHHRSVRL